ncbi:MAG: phage protease [Candidatus Accumulibacter phosphatis]
MAELSRARDRVTMPKRFPLPPWAPARDNLLMPRPIRPSAAHPPPVIATLAVALEVDPAGSAPSVVRLIPAGAFRSVDGRPVDAPAWRLDAALAAPIVAAAAQRQSDYVIDYEHQTLLARENGKPAPAAGWYHDLEWREDGLYATDVCWTPAAARMIQAQEYRYVSPVFGYDRETGDVRHLACAALVSNPGLDGLTDLSGSLERLAAKLFTPLENSMNDELLEPLRWLLNLPLGATVDEITIKLEKLTAQIKADVPEAATSAHFDLSAHLRWSQQPDPSQYVAIAALHAVQQELSTVRQEQAEVRLQAMIEAGLAQHKLVPSLLAWARELGSRDCAALATYLEAAVPVVPPGTTQTGGKSPGTGINLQDPNAIARAAQDFQAAEEAAGRHLSIADAVAHIISR